MSQFSHFQGRLFQVGWGVTFYSARFWINCLLACLFLVTGPSRLAADIEVPKGVVRVPLAKPGRLEAIRGFPVEITLAGATSTTRMLQFIIRQQPRHGRLDTPPVQAGRENATVRYTANPTSTAEVDIFTFATKVEGSGSSEEAAVTIRLVDPAAVLEAPGGVDLGRILAGETINKTITIANIGNAAWQGVVPLPDGWSWLSPAGGRFDLAAGARTEATLRVRVAEPGGIDEKVNLHTGATVRIIGRAVPPFLAYPSLLRLQWDREKRERAWRLGIRNNTGEPMTVRLGGAPGLIVPASVTLPAGESQEVSVGWAAALNRAGSGQIVLEAPGWRQEVSFEAPIAPPAVDVIGLAADGTVDFGLLEKAEGPGAVKTFTLKNVGGAAAVIRWDPLRFFMVQGLEPEFVLASGAERWFSLRPRPDEPGRLKEELLLRMNGGDRLLKLAADIDPAAAKAALMQGTVLQVKPPSYAGPVGNGTPITEDGFRLRTQILHSGLMQAFPNQDRKLPTVDQARLIVEETKPDKLVYEWNAPAPGKWTYRVMVRMLRNHGPLQAPIPEYDQMDNVKVTNTPTGGRAEVTKLRPGAFWSCRIVAIREDGVSTKPGGELRFITPPVPDSRWGWRLLAVLGTISLALYIRQKWREDVKWKE